MNDRRDFRSNTLPSDLDRDEARIARLLAASHATPDPTVLARVRARLAAPEVPRAFRWLATPAALAGGFAALVLAAGLTFAMFDRDAASAATTNDASLVSALIGDDGSDGLPANSAAATNDAGPTDSDKVAP
jgi:hypothetical protein